MTTEGNDIALVRLPRPAITSYEDPLEPVLPICLAWRSGSRVPNGELLVAGWGRTTNDPSDRGEIKETGTFTSVLLQLQVPLVPINSCKANYRLFKDISSTKHLCAGGDRGMPFSLFTFQSDQTCLFCYQGRIPAVETLEDL